MLTDTDKMVKFSVPSSSRRWADCVDGFQTSQTIYKPTHPISYPLNSCPHIQFSIKLVPLAPVPDISNFPLKCSIGDNHTAFGICNNYVLEAQNTLDHSLEANDTVTLPLRLHARTGMHRLSSSRHPAGLPRNG
jgi:hypothetical protein